ncbi:MAG: hypothetical protein HY548_04495 [Elusimicrobia bacterium]|nr:hypothetical protein [Elusimicrobiota bacterium]
MEIKAKLVTGVGDQVGIFVDDGCSGIVCPGAEAAKEILFRVNVLPVRVAEMQRRIFEMELKLAEPAEATQS